MSHLSMTCIFKPAWLLIAFQQQVADITIHMSKNDGLENYKKKKFFFFFFFGFSHPGGSASLVGVRESGCISGRLPDDPGGFTCMYISRVKYTANKGKVAIWGPKLIHAVSKTLF